MVEIVCCCCCCCCCLLASRAYCHGLLDTPAARGLASMADESLRTDARPAAAAGCPSWGVAARVLLWDLDGGRGTLPLLLLVLMGLGKRENPPAAGGGADMAAAAAADREVTLLWHSAGGSNGRRGYARPVLAFLLLLFFAFVLASRLLRLCAVSTHTHTHTHTHIQGAWRQQQVSTGGAARPFSSCVPDPPPLPKHDDSGPLWLTRNKKQTKIGAASLSSMAVRSPSVGWSGTQGQQGSRASQGSESVFIHSANV